MELGARAPEFFQFKSVYNINTTNNLYFEIKE